MNLATDYCGIELSSPLVVGASPLVDDLDVVKRLEDSGASAIVMRSLFQEQIERESMNTFAQIEGHAHMSAEALSFFPDTDDYVLGPHNHIDQLAKLKAAVSIPVIASLNGTTPGGWLEYAKLMEDAGADALELNFYELAADFDRSGADIENELVAIVEELVRATTIPISVKLSPFWSSLPHLAKRLVAAGAKGLVLFNRFYQADIDVEALEYENRLQLSHSRDLLLRLRAIAILRGRLDTSLICTGGAHTVPDLVKALMSGADAVQFVAALLTRGPEHLKVLRDGLEIWMAEHGHESLEGLRGNMSLERCPDPHALLRGNYAQMLRSWTADREGYYS
ncbi:MAG: dihydroorotate dehydrogenase-like protein [Planctomycetes bacterium]|nr:dihydroorotate dehydrogenase-like protein [Planctomycetota bacterium]